MKYRVTVPPTHDMGSYSAVCRDIKHHTYQEDALIDYNISRQHDDLPPLKRMPCGTVYTPVPD